MVKIFKVIASGIGGGVTSEFVEIGGFYTLERGWCSLYKKVNRVGRKPVRKSDLFVADRGDVADTNGVPLGVRLAPSGAFLDFEALRYNEPEWPEPADEGGSRSPAGGSINFKFTSPARLR